MRLWDFIKSKMLLNPLQTVCENNAKLSFDELVCFSEMFAQKLKGIKCCAILCQSEMAASMALLACFAAEVTAVPLSLRYGEIHCNRILDTISPDAVITDENGYFQIKIISKSKYITPQYHPAIIMCTSGTTGKPKGVMLSEKNIVTNVNDISAYFAIDKTDSILIARPLYHCAVLTGEFLTALAKGCRIQFYSESFNPPLMLEIITKNKITAFCGTPTLFNMMVRFKKESSDCFLKHICVSGECMGKEIGQKIYNSFPNCNIYHVYGLTEACPRVCFLPPEEYKMHPDSVGIPLKSVSVKLIDNNGNECEKNKKGVLWVKGDNVMLGYYNNPKKTHAVIKNGWLCTGDVAVMNENGFLKIIGRNDQLIIKSGMNIYPAEIESVIEMDDRTTEVLVYGFDSKYGTQIGMKISGSFNSVEEVKKLCIKSLPKFQIPSKIEIVKNIPKNGTGKIIRSIQNDRV